ncbi:MAG: hypothetical protein JJE34_10505 [Alphaproteobacteria bacterium]|nr:hypothetical protein [Alphaproteobacteria bacterium]
MKNSVKIANALWAVLLLTTACSDSNNVKNEDAEINRDVDLASESVPNDRPGSTMNYPVPIGEDGPRFDACGGVGRVRGSGGDDGLEVMAAPFDDTQMIGRIASGHNLFICTRSIDQKWFGVVYAGEGQEAGDCGVSSPIRNRRNYAGPCKSGWVSSAFVRLVAE